MKQYNVTFQFRHWKKAPTNDGKESTPPRRAAKQAVPVSSFLPDPYYLSPWLN